MKRLLMGIALFALISGGGCGCRFDVKANGDDASPLIPVKIREELHGSHVLVEIEYNDEIHLLVKNKWQSGAYIQVGSRPVRK